MTPAFKTSASEAPAAETATEGSRPGGLVHAPGRRLVLEASGLEPRMGFALRDGAIVPDAHIDARARLPRDTLGCAGVAEPAGEMPLAIRPLPEGGGAARMLLGLSHGGEAAGYEAVLWLPPEAFAALRLDAEAGRAARLSLIATTNLWLEQGERDAPAGRPVAWTFGRDGEGAAMPARGLVERIDWSAAAAEPDTTGIGATPLPAATQAAADDEEPAEAIGDALGRLNWGLKQIALVLVFLMIIVALK
jgi:hypothetical protein